MGQTLIRALNAPIRKSTYYHRHLGLHLQNCRAIRGHFPRALEQSAVNQHRWYLVTLWNKITTERTVYPRGGQLQMFYDKLTDTFRVWVRLNGILTDVYKSLCLMSLNETASQLGTGELCTTQGHSLRTNAPDTPLGLPWQHTLTENRGLLPHNYTHGLTGHIKLLWTHTCCFIQGWLKAYCF